MKINRDRLIITKYYLATLRKVSKFTFSGEHSKNFLFMGTDIRIFKGRNWNIFHWTWDSFVLSKCFSESFPIFRNSLSDGGMMSRIVMSLGTVGNESIHILSNFTYSQELFRQEHITGNQIYNLNSKTQTWPEIPKIFKSNMSITHSVVV